MHAFFDRLSTLWIHFDPFWRLGDPGHDCGQRREFAVSGCGELHADQQLRSQVAWPCREAWGNFPGHGGYPQNPWRRRNLGLKAMTDPNPPISETMIFFPSFLGGCLAMTMASDDPQEAGLPLCHQLCQGAGKPQTSSGALNKGRSQVEPMISTIVCLLAGPESRLGWSCFWEFGKPSSGSFRMQRKKTHRHWLKLRGLILIDPTFVSMLSTIPHRHLSISGSWQAQPDLAILAIHSFRKDSPKE